MRIDVTQEDIDKGQRGRCARCPIAVAIRRYVNRSVLVWIEFGTATLTTGALTSIRELPDKAQLFIESFDEGKPVTPFHFGLQIPNRYVRARAGE